LKKPISERAGGVAQVVECLPSSEYEAQSSNPSAAKKGNQDDKIPVTYFILFFYLFSF
jgi:hypothetical protein